MKAIWNGQVIAESNQTQVIEGNHYFPPQSVRMEFLTANEHISTCHWKGIANYFDITVDDQINQNGGWIYKNPSEAANKIKKYIAFWHGVEIVE